MAEYFNKLFSNVGSNVARITKNKKSLKVMKCNHFNLYESMLYT